MLLALKTGDDSEHKKVLVAIRIKKRETEAVIANHRRIVKDVEDGLREDQALLKKALGDTSAIQKRIAGNKSSLKVLTAELVEFVPQVEGRAREEKALIEALRLIDKARKAKKP